LLRVVDISNFITSLYNMALYMLKVVPLA